MSEQIKEIPKSIGERVEELEKRLEDYVQRFRALELNVQYAKYELSRLSNRH